MSTNCIVPEDVTGFLINCQPVELCCSYEKIQEAIDVAVDIAERFTGQKWCPVYRCVTFKGTGKNKIFFPDETYWWLNELDSVSVVSGGVDVDLGIENFENRHHWLEFLCGCFACGKKYRICGIWGKDIPPGLKHGIILHTLEILSPGITGLNNPGGVIKAAWEDFAVTYRVDETFNDLRPTTGYREIDNIYMSYINSMSEIGFSVIPDDEDCYQRNCGKISRNLCSSHVDQVCGGSSGIGVTPPVPGLPGIGGGNEPPPITP